MNDIIWLFSISKDLGSWFADRVDSLGIKRRVFDSPEELLSEANSVDSLPILIVLKDDKSEGSWRNIGKTLSQKWGERAYLILSGSNLSAETISEGLKLGYKGVAIRKENQPEGDFENELKESIQRGEEKLQIWSSLFELKRIVDFFVSDIARIARKDNDLLLEVDQSDPVKVLVIDSDTSGQGEPIYEKLGEEPNVSLATTESGEKALEMVREELFDIFIVDNELSDRGALDLMKELSDYCPGSESIFVVGFTAADTAVDALRWGAASFLIKPFPAEDLIASVEKLFSRVNGRKVTRRALQSFTSKSKGVWEKIGIPFNSPQG